MYKFNDLPETMLRLKAVRTIFHCLTRDPRTHPLSPRERELYPRSVAPEFLPGCFLFSGRPGKIPLQ
jgi:hypothetical protein